MGGLEPARSHRDCQGRRRPLGEAHQDPARVQPRRSLRQDLDHRIPQRQSGAHQPLSTWCGPCNAELPQLQKVYDQAKGRSDVQILTFNIDEDLGLVEPFLKEKGYTFPVLPAYSYVVSLPDGYAIPQNWLLNLKGEWQWTQLGYGSDDAWVKDMLAKLDAMKSGT
jgi:thiol-disulfide isomerase/thioredoxin